MIKCKGCGAPLQNSDQNKEGYVKDLTYSVCERCFKIKNYNEYIASDKTPLDFLNKINEINGTNDLVLLTLDFLNLTDLSSLKLNNPIILVITKKDILPDSIFEEKILRKINYDLNIVDKLFVSSKNNYNLDLLIEKIMKYKTSNNVYVIGPTNAGKSSLINKIVKNYGNFDSNITVSSMPSTTIDFIEVKLNDQLTLIDSPGLLDNGSIILNASKDELKKIVPNKKIRPIIYQIKMSQSIIIEDFCKLDVDNPNNIILYISNDLDVKRLFKANDKLNHLKVYEFNVNSNEDLVIAGLGFITFKHKGNIKLYLNNSVKFFVRKSIV